ncbi:hypothetical protein [Metamycoplasma buccale]|uniref:hypothetical protein n=1 Tax=Metamycoplasma buccale TaxID=55602 RepID=UPI00398EDF42
MKVDQNQNDNYSKNNSDKKIDIDELINEIKQVFGLEVANAITNIRFYYESFYNKTYIGKFNNVWVQIRVPKNLFFDYKNEEKILKKFKDYLFINKGYVIKKWFPGQDLFKMNVNSKIQSNLFNCLNNFQKLDIKLKKFDWLKYDIKDKKYLRLVNKYKDEKYVVSHNNIKRHNVLINKYNFIKLISFEDAAYNSRYVDPVSLYLFLGCSKKDIISFFDLDENIFNDYIYMLKIFNEEAYKITYSKSTFFKNKLNESLLKIQNKDHNNFNRFIIQKFHNQYDNRLDLNEISQFYFVPTCVYEDNERIIWRWLNCNAVSTLNTRQIKVLAKAMKMYHDSDAKFPSYILKDKVLWYLENINKDWLYQEMGGKEIVDKIVSWINDIKPDSNCHNDLNLDNVFFTENLNLYIINWATAYKSNRYLDIAFMFENTNINKTIEKSFWLAYGQNEPKDFYKYRIISHFVDYLYNMVLNIDYNKAKINLMKVKEIFNEIKE